MKLSKMNKGEGVKPLEVHFGDEVLHLEYSRSTITPKFEEDLQESIKNNLPGQALSKMLQEVIVSWDLEDWDPDDMETPEENRRTIPVPVDAEVFHDKISVEAMAKIVEAITEDNRPKETTSKPTKEF